MPLTTRLIFLKTQNKPQAKFSTNRHMSPSFVQENQGQNVLNKLTPRPRQNIESRSPFFRGRKTTRKNMYSALSCRALLKKAKEIDPKDPTQSYLPKKREPSSSKMTSNSPKDKIKKLSTCKSETITVETPGILKRVQIKQKKQPCKKQPGQQNLAFQLESLRQEQDSLTKLILFGDLKSIEFKPLDQRISNGEYKEYVNFLEALREKDPITPHPSIDNFIN